MNVKNQQIVLILTISFFFIVFTGYPAAAQWTITTVDSTGNVGRDTSLALDDSGNPRISYYRFDTGDLKYAWCDTGCDVSGNWNTVPVDSAGDAGEYTSLALDGSGNPRMSYYAFDTGALKYAWCDAGCDNSSNWNRLTVNSAGTVGADTSLALDGSWNPRISYHDDVNNNLQYTWCDVNCANTGNWTAETVASTGDVGLYTSLVLDGSGNPRVSYYKYDTDDLNYAWCDTGCDNPGNWNSIMVDSEDNVGLYTSLALDSSNNPRISYQDGTSLDLYYTWCDAGCDDPGNWNRVTVDSAGTVGVDTSLALDSSDNPRISYYGNDTLKYAWCDTACNDPGNWNIETVDSTAGSVGEYTSLKLDGSDIPHISYYDLTNGNLKYAYAYDDDRDDDGISNTEDNCPDDYNPDQEDIDCDGIGDICDGLIDCTEGADCDNDCDGIYNQNDNCPVDYNPLQQDSYPPQGNNIGDACDCECDFDCDGDVDAGDVTSFLTDFGRSWIINPCANGNPCNGDCECDTDVDSADVEKLLEDFGRSWIINPCPACVPGDWCVYP
jgi:hypothetical protein